MESTSLFQIFLTNMRRLILSYRRLSFLFSTVLFTLFISTLVHSEQFQEREITLSKGPLTIDSALSIALDQNHTVRGYQVVSESAKRAVNETKAEFGFNLSLTGSYQRVEDPTETGDAISTYNLSPITVSGSNIFAITDPAPMVSVKKFQINSEYQHYGGLELVKPLFTFGKRDDAISISRKGSEIASLDIELSRITIAAKVKASFHAVLLTNEVVKLQEESLSRAERHLGDAEELFNSGLGVKFDVLRARTEVQKVKEELTTARKNRTLAKKALNSILGNQYGESIDVSGRNAFIEIQLDSLDDYQRIAIEKRPELKQLKKGREMAKLGAELSRNKPEIAFVGSWNFHARGNMMAAQDSWRAMLAAEMPIFDNGLSRAKESQALLKEKKLSISEVELTHGIKLQTESAYLDMIDAAERLKTSKNILEVAEEAYRIIALSYKEGFAKQIDVIDVENELTGAELNHSVSKFDYEVSKSRLSQACGLISLE